MQLKYNTVQKPCMTSQYITPLNSITSSVPFKVRIKGKRISQQEFNSHKHQPQECKFSIKLGKING